MSIDLALFEAANRLVCLSSATFYQALMLSNRPSWVLAAMAFVAMWFPRWAPGEAIERVRLEARSRVVLLFGALVGAFGMARVVSALIHRPRPIGAIEVPSPIPPAEWASIKGALAQQGAFPSDHAAMFAVVVVGLFAFDRRAGRLGLLLALGFAVLRVGVGFHWPSDMAAGALIGAAAAALALRLRPHVSGWLQPLLLWTERLESFTYPLLFLVALDFSQKFAGLFALLASLTGHEIAH